MNIRILKTISLALLCCISFCQHKHEAQASEYPQDEVGVATEAAIKTASSSVIQIDTIGAVSYTHLTLPTKA